MLHLLLISSSSLKNSSSFLVSWKKWPYEFTVFFRKNPLFPISYLKGSTAPKMRTSHLSWSSSGVSLGSFLLFSTLQKLCNRTLTLFNLQLHFIPILCPFSASLYAKLAELTVLSPGLRQYPWDHLDAVRATTWTLKWVSTSADSQNWLQDQNLMGLCLLCSDRHSRRCSVLRQTWLTPRCFCSSSQVFQYPFIMTMNPWQL